MAFSQSGGKVEEEPYDHIKDSAFFYDVTEQFKQQMLLDMAAKCEVSTISKVSNNTFNPIKNAILSYIKVTVMRDL